MENWKKIIIKSFGCGSPNKIDAVSFILIGKIINYSMIFEYSVFIQSLLMSVSIT